MKNIALTSNNKLITNLNGKTMKKEFQLNPATGMAMGAIVAALISIVVQVITKDNSIWIWSIPIGIAVGLPIGITAKKKRSSNKEKGENE